MLSVAASLAASLDFIDQVDLYLSKCLVVTLTPTPTGNGWVMVKKEEEFYMLNAMHEFISLYETILSKLTPMPRRKLKEDGFTHHHQFSFLNARNKVAPQGQRCTVSALLP